MADQIQKLELYIHIPFCIKKCRYCDFISFAGCEALYDSYLDALCKEIVLKAPAFRNREISTVYIGGGTPSILNCDQISRLVETLQHAFSLSHTHEKRRGLFLQKKIRPLTEFSIECNPGTADEQKLRIWRKLGINRLSIGLQSTDNEDLKVLGRIHTYEDFVRIFSQARNAGYDNINVDLMQAIPGQTLSGWKRVLAVLGTWSPEHISAYSLIIEEGTEFARLKEAGRLYLPDEDTEREIYYYTKEFLEKAGYYRYEISNYARPGFACRHNCGYWQGADYLGLGLHASSLVDHKRWKNTDDLQHYISVFSRLTEEDMAKGIAQEEFAREICSSITEDMEQLSRKEQMEEFMILGLRMCEGINRKEFLDRFGQDVEFVYGEHLRKMKDMRLLEMQGDQIRLTERGIDVSNAVLSGFMN